MLKTDFENSDLHIGIDESGRGPLAGPVVVAAVIFDYKNTDLDLLKGITDSKKVSKKKRELLEKVIKDNALCWSTSVVSNKIIDDINILQATLKGMETCVDKIVSQCKSENIKFDRILVDGNHFKPYFNPWLSESNTNIVIPHSCVIKGDATYLSIAAASILAKVEHDRCISNIIDEHPEYCEQYNWQNNMCYGTKAHIEGIKKHGITSLHRKSFCSKYIKFFHD